MIVKHGEDWKSIAARKQAKREAAIPQEWKVDCSQYANLQNVLDVPNTCGLLSSKELLITQQYDAVALLEKLKTRHFSVEEVVTAFCKRAAIAQQLSNCLSEIMFNEAIDRARSLDKQSTEPSFIPPKLFGLPISLKDSFQVIGTDATIGMIYFAGQESTSNSALVDLLLMEGAIIYCKTNVPQTMMTADSDNNVFGRTINPANRTLTAGGSTGGEGALIALRGSILGVGSDIAGSIRIPSHCNGFYGLKPSVGIFPMGNKRNPGRDGLAGIAPVVGPMATSARSCGMLLQVIMEANPWKLDPDCLHLPWRNTQLPLDRRLRIGIAEDDGQLTPTPPMRRAIRETQKRLVDSGVEVVPVKLCRVAEDMRLVWTSFSMDGSRTLVERLKTSDEPYVNSVAQTGLVSMPGMTLEELFDFNRARTEVQARYQKLWLSNDLDALILPPAPFTAPKIDTWLGNITYTALWNLLDYPAAIIPVGRVTKEDQPDSASRYGSRDEELYKQYTSPADFADAPITIQLVGMHQEDEHFALVLQHVDQILNSPGLSK